MGARSYTAVLRNGTREIASLRMDPGCGEAVELYEKTLRYHPNSLTAMKKLAEDRFVQKWDSFETLHKLKLWWEKTPYFVITPVGRILAHTNAKRCDPKIPDLI